MAFNYHQDIDEQIHKSNRGTRVIASVSALGILLFLAVALTFPLKNQILANLYPKPVSHAENINFVCTPCSADIDQNGIVGDGDFTQLQSCLNRSADAKTALGGSCQNADINQDGKIDNQDLDCLKSQFDQICQVK